MIKVFRSDSASVALSTESLNFYPLPSGVTDCLSTYEMAASEESPNLYRDDSGDQTPEIAGLILLTAQTCNLKCSYCFAGAYMRTSSPGQVMSPTTASLAMEKILGGVSESPWVQFFGGEPLLNFDAIKESVLKTERHCSSRKWHIPAFTVVTNGTLLDREMVAFFDAHHFTVAVSLDGPQPINDKHRQFPSGPGTYDIVEKKIELLRNAGIGFRIDAVFTHDHRNSGETIESTYGFLLKYGSRDICITPAIGAHDQLISDKSLKALEQSYTASTERIMDSWLTDSPIKLSYWMDIVNTLISRNGKTHFCGAGLTSVTVDCSGRVFPCHMLIADSLCMGNIHDRDFPGEDFRRVTTLMQQTSKDSFTKCTSCWAKKMCSLCYGDSFHLYGVLNAPSESMCVIFRSVARATLLKIGEFMTDEVKWKSFFHNLSLFSAARFDVDCKDRLL